MGNLNDPKVRQQFLADAINEQLNKRREAEKKNNLLSDNKFVGKLVDFFDNKDEKAYRQLSKRLGLWGTNGK
jgi:hypothetical protein